MGKHLVFGVLFLSSLVGYALPEHGNMSFAVQVVASCRIKSYHAMSWPVLFGTFPQNIDNTTGAVITDCTKKLPFTLGINNGTHYDPITATRRLGDGRGHFVNYSIYSDPAYSRPWGNLGTSQALSELGTGSSFTNILYARIPAGQPAVPFGSYQDTLLVTLEF